MGFKGSVESFSLADVFQNLAMNQQTGTLRVTTDTNEQKHVYFEDGHVRYLSKGANAVILPAEVFLARGYIVKSNFESAQAYSKETNENMVSSLVSMGYVNDEQVSEVLEHQIEEEIYDLFGWEKAEFEFNEGAMADSLYSPETAGRTVSLSVSHLIMEAARRVDEWERLKRLIPSFKEIYVVDLAVRKAIERGEMETEPVERRVVSLIDGARDVDDAIEDSHLFKFEVLCAVAEFIQSSVLRAATISELNFSEQECQRHELPKRRIKILERILALGGENQRVRRELADLLARFNQVDKACIHYSVIADSELRSEREENAIELYKRILSIHPTHVKSREQLATLYTKRGQKREALVHYHELFDTLKEQSLLKEAREAAEKALECDPTNNDLRNALIELLLAENLRDEAAEQLEILGDMSTKQRNATLASYSYRRALQLRPGNRVIKKKLNVVMVSREDLIQRRRKIMAALAAVVLAVVICGGLFFKEVSNSKQYQKAEIQARDFIKQANTLNQQGKYIESARFADEARKIWAPLRKLFSPVVGYDKQALREFNEADDKWKGALQRQELTDKNLKAQAEADEKDGDRNYERNLLLDAKASYVKLEANTQATPEQLKKAKERITELSAKTDELEKEKKRVFDENPERVFRDLAQEFRDKREFDTRFSRYIGPLKNQITLPVQFTCNADNVRVLVNGEQKAVYKRMDALNRNVIRYPLVGSHRIQFVKTGYKTVEFLSGDLQIANQLSVDVRMTREAARVLDLRPYFGAQMRLSGDVYVDADARYVYLGTNTGSVIQISDNMIPINKRWDHREGEGITRAIYSPIFVLKNTNKPETIVFCNVSGECFGIQPAAAGFSTAWTAKIDTGGKSLSVQPSFLKLAAFQNRTMLIAPFGKRLIIIDPATGTIEMKNHPSLECPNVITSSPTATADGRMIFAGADDGSLYGFSPIEGSAPKQWTNKLGLPAPIRAKPVIFAESNIVVAGNDSGALVLFDARTPGPKTGEIQLRGTIESEPLLFGAKAFVGANTADGFWCADIPTGKILWQSKEFQLGGIRTSPLYSNGRVYFGTDTGRLYALHAENGDTAWTYVLPNALPFLCAPRVLSGKIYAFCVNGEIYVFEESE